MDRYICQKRLEQFGDEGQARISRAKVLVIGCGGLGVFVCQHLIGSGIGLITLFDGDIVRIDNLHRQTIYGEQDVFLNKAEVLKKFGSNLNSEVKIVAKNRFLSPSEAEIQVANHDIVVDAADNFASSYMLSDCCNKLGKPLVYAAVSRSRGYASCLCQDSPSLRAIFPQPAFDTGSCADEGVLGSLVGLVGSLQAYITLEFILSQVTNKLMFWCDLQYFRFGSFSIQNAKEPSEYSIFRFIDPFSDNAVLIDIRSNEEILIDPFPGRYVHFPSIDKLYDFVKQIEDHSKIILHCRRGNRSWKAAIKLREQGFEGELFLSAQSLLNKEKSE